MPESKTTLLSSQQIKDRAHRQAKRKYPEKGNPGYWDLVEETAVLHKQVMRVSKEYSDLVDEMNRIREEFNKMRVQMKQFGFRV